MKENRLYFTSNSVSSIKFFIIVNKWYIGLLGRVVFIDKSPDSTSDICSSGQERLIQKPLSLLSQTLSILPCSEGPLCFIKYMYANNSVIRYKKMSSIKNLIHLYVNEINSLYIFILLTFVIFQPSFGHLSVFMGY